MSDRTEMLSDEDVLDEARSRYLTDAMFHAAVDTAREVVWDKGNVSGDRDFATQAAAVALVIYTDATGDAGCTCARSIDRGAPRP